MKVLRKLIDLSKVVSFDIFDTLLVRPYAAPCGVFFHLEQQYACPGFCDIRKLAEGVAHKHFSVAHVSYDEIYEIIPTEYQHLKELEKELEKNTLYQNPEMKEVYDYAVTQGKKIIFTTDMYLDEETLSFALQKNGFGQYDKMYISAYLRKAKHDFMLFPHIIDDLGVSPQEILHIGDNRYADYLAPRKAGMVAYNIKSPKEQLFEAYPRLYYFYQENKNSFTADVIIGMLIKYFVEKKKFKNYWEMFGYVWGGPVCYGLSKFIHTEMQKQNVSEILCVARDGYTIEKILKEIDSTIKTHYIYASRAISILTTLDYKESKSQILIRLYKELSAEFAALFPKKDFSNNQECIDFIKMHMHIVTPLANKMYDAYVSYIETFKITDNKIALFDLSAGSFTSLMLMHKMLPSKDILALYWFVLANCPLDTIICKTYSSEFKENNDLLEFMVTAPELPVSGVTEDGEIMRIDNKYEQIRANAYEYVFNGELAYAKDIIALYGTDICFDVKVLNNLIHIFDRFPTKDDCRNFKNIYHGVNEDHSIYAHFIHKKSCFTRYIKLVQYEILSLLLTKNNYFSSRKHKYKNQIQEIKKMRQINMSMFKKRCRSVIQKICMLQRIFRMN